MQKSQLPGTLKTRFSFRVEKLAMPFATNVQQILKSKLGVDSKMGATYGKAYCGGKKNNLRRRAFVFRMDFPLKLHYFKMTTAVVGGIERHEYAVLGPSVSSLSIDDTCDCTQQPSPNKEL